MHYIKGRHHCRPALWRVLWPLCVGVLVVGAPHAEAQTTPVPPCMGPSPSAHEGEEKKEGVAEAAPKTPGLLPTTPALPAPKGRRKRWKLLEMDGYYRMRTDWFRNFNLGFPDIDPK